MSLQLALSNKFDYQLRDSACVRMSPSDPAVCILFFGATRSESSELG